MVFRERAVEERGHGELRIRRVIEIRELEEKLVLELLRRLLARRVHDLHGARVDEHVLGEREPRAEGRCERVFCIDPDLAREVDLRSPTAGRGVVGGHVVFVGDDQIDEEQPRSERIEETLRVRRVPLALPAPRATRAHHDEPRLRRARLEAIGEANGSVRGPRTRRLSGAFGGRSRRRGPAG